MPPEIRRLLYSTDLSHNSIYAFRYAAYLAKLTGAEIHILHVLEALSDDARFTIEAYVMEASKRHKILDERLERAKARLMERQDKYWAEQSAEDQKYRDNIKTIDVCESYPAEEILKRAKQYDCDLIIMGGHERGISHTFLGSVAKSVLRRARVPTLIVPLPEED
ncbi:MAG: universal stress protein [Kiloniellales bacterium]|nr:universal stress protein [Kiloniellales bacterium]